MLRAARAVIPEQPLVRESAKCIRGVPFCIAASVALDAVSASPAYSATYQGSGRTGGRVVARDEAARSFRVMCRNRSWAHM